MRKQYSIMTSAGTIYQLVKVLPFAKALEVLHFLEFLESKPDSTPEPGARSPEPGPLFFAVCPSANVATKKSTPNFRQCATSGINHETFPGRLRHHLFDRLATGIRPKNPLAGR